MGDEWQWDAGDENSREEEEWGGKNRKNKKRVKPDWECLPRVVRVTLNYKWSHFPSQNTQPQYNIQGAFPLAGQFTAPHGLAIATNLCLLPSFFSVHLPIFSGPGVKDFANS